MALVPFEMLEGNIEQIKEIAIGDAQIERWYEDDNGNRSILVMEKIVE